MRKSTSFNYFNYLKILFLLIYLNSYSCNNLQYASIVVARYKDPLPSTLGYPLNYLKYPHYIYNKGIDDFPKEYNVIIELSNVGREGFIYLKHIYNNYYNLTNVTIFAQYDHLMGKTICPVVEAIMNGYKLTFENDGFAFVGEGCMDMTYHEFIFGYEDYGTEIQTVYEHIHSILGEKHLVKDPRFVPTGLFAVTREAIHRNPRNFYRILAQKLGADNNPFEGHFLERAWPEVFLSTCSKEKKFHCILHLHHHERRNEFQNLSITSL